MRKPPVVLLAVMAIGTLAGFARSGPEEPMLLLRTIDEIALVDPEDEGRVLGLNGAVASLDASVVVQSVQVDGVTRVSAVDAASGTERWSREVPEGFEAKVVSNGAALVALGPSRGGQRYPAGRSSTTLVLTGEEQEDARAITLPGNIEPEAFSVDARDLFVIEYLPPLAPDRYRVRRLELATERVQGVFSVDSKLQSAMRGTARVQAASRDGRRLYTLYSVAEEDGSSHSFVHVLSLDELWAHCVDLPIGFAQASEERTGLALSDDGKRLFVADPEAGHVAEIDTEELRVTRSVDLGVQLDGASVSAVIGPDDTLYVGSGHHLLSIDTGPLEATHRWELPGPLSGVQVARDSIYVGLRDGILQLDRRTRERVRFLDPPVRTIDRFGLWSRPLPPERENISCAC